MNMEETWTWTNRSKMLQLPSAQVSTALSTSWHWIWLNHVDSISGTLIAFPNTPGSPHVTTTLVSLSRTARTLGAEGEIWRVHPARGEQSLRVAQDTPIADWKDEQALLLYIYIHTYVYIYICMYIYIFINHHKPHSSQRWVNLPTS